MHATYPLLQVTDFPLIQRKTLEVLQVNLGYYCNMTCLHCHVNAGPTRKEMMSSETADKIIEFLEISQVHTLDLTGGAPELHDQFYPLVKFARKRGIRVIDRCNLTVLFEPGYEGLADFLAEYKVDIVASLPCYLEDNVNAQRGKGVYQKSIDGLLLLNDKGYGQMESDLILDLVFNPQGPVLPPPQAQLQLDYKKFLVDEFGITFNQLLTLTNLPIKRFGSTLISKGRFQEYMALLKSAYQEDNLSSLMCRNTLSLDYLGHVYDCDFNQMLAMPLGASKKPVHISDIVENELAANPIAIADHCYGCTAGQGSSCGGALNV